MNKGQVILLAGCLVLGGCKRAPLDPLVVDRMALVELGTEPLASDWSPQASVSMSSELLNRLLSVDIGLAISAQMVPTEHEILGMKAQIRPDISVESFWVSPTDACESCLQMDLVLDGSHEVDLVASSGLTTLSQGWRAKVRSVLHLGVTEAEDGVRGLTAGLAKADEWSVQLELANLPDMWSMVLGTLLNKEVQSLVGRPDIPAILLVELGESEPVSIRDVRVRTLGDGAIALDLNFLIPSAGESLVEKGPGSGWSVNVPEETLLGLMQAAALMAPVGDEPLAIQPEGLVIGKAGFILDIRALSKKRFGQYKEFMIMGTVGLNERGEIDLVANEALLSGSSTNRPDLLTLLLKQKILQTVASALTMSIPGIYSEELGERTVRLAIESLRMGEGEIEVAGDLEFGRVVEEGTPTVLTPKRE